MAEPAAPTVSVVVIVFDGERFLAEALESIATQSLDRWEALVVDDGSRDRSLAIARAFAERHPGKVRLLTHPGGANRGMSASRNLGIAAARGEFVTFLDHDDAMLSAKLESQVALLRARPACAAAIGPNLRWRSWSGSRVGAGRANGASTHPSGDEAQDGAQNEVQDEVQDLGVRAFAGGPRGDGRAPDVGPRHGLADELANERERAPESALERGPGSALELDPPGLLPMMLANAAATPQAPMVRRETLRRIGGFEESFRGMYEDQVFLAKLFLAERVVVSSEVWHRYRQHDASCVRVAHRAGAQHAARRRFLAWLEGRLQAEDRGGAGFGPGRADLRALLRQVRRARWASWRSQFGWARLRRLLGVSRS